MSPKITAIEVLMGIPPIDSYCSSIEIKFLIKSVNKDDLVTATHVKTLTRPSSLSSLLLSKLRRFERIHMSHSYTRDSIKAFIRDNWNRRWNSSYNNNFLRNFISNLPQETIHSPSLDGNPLIANMISDLLIGSARRLAENLWKLSRTPSPMCICGTSEQNSYNYFFYCPNYCNFRPFHLISLDFFLSDDCAIIRNFISGTNIRVNGNGSKEMGRIGLLCHGSNLHRFGIGSNGLGSTLKNAKFKGDNILISTQVHSTSVNSTKRVDLILFDLFHAIPNIIY